FELLGFPVRDGVLVAELRWMPVGLNVVVVLRAALHVHIAGIPVAIFNGGLRSPVCPDAELGVSKPFGNFVTAERFPRALKRALFDLNARRRFRFDRL